MAGYAYDDKHNGKHTDGKHDDLYPHGAKHAKHDKDATFAYQIIETDRTFVYDDAGKLLQAVETEDNYGTYTYNYEYDLMGNRTYMEKVDADGDVAEWHKYVYNDSNQLVSEQLYNGKKTTSLTYEYDADGNRISETGKIGTDKVEKTYEYTVENRLAAVYDADELLIATAYDGDGNRVFQLNYNLHTDEDWKDNSGNGNGSNKDNSGSGNSSSSNKKNNGNSSANNGKGGNGKNNTTDTSTGTSTGNGNATNAEEHNSQNQCGILFPVAENVSATEQSLIDQIKTTGKQKNYELIEYINDVNREYTEVLVEQNINGKTDTSYIYGVERLSLDRFDGSTGYYLYDPRGSVTGITNEEGQIYQSYRYDANGGISFGAPTYENEYTYNGESYNPNIESQYLRARYYDVVTAVFYTEDTYLGNIIEPLTLNRYNYCVASPLNYVDPSGNVAVMVPIQPIKNVMDDFAQVIAETGKTGVAALKEVAYRNVIEKEQKRTSVGDSIEDYLENTESGGQVLGALNGILSPLTTMVEIPFMVRDIVKWDVENWEDTSTNVHSNFYAGVGEEAYFEVSTVLDAEYMVYSAILATDSLDQALLKDTLTEEIKNGVREVSSDESSAEVLINCLTVINNVNEFCKDFEANAKEYIHEAGVAFMSGESDEEFARAAGAASLQITMALVAKASSSKCGTGGNKGGTHVLPNAEDLKMSQTVQNHMNDVIKRGPNAGQLSRPYIDSDGTTLLLKEIMESADPVPDAILQSGLRWDVSGTFRGSTGTWELVVDTSTNTVVHFNFVAQ